MRRGVGTALIDDAVERLRRDGVQRPTVSANPNALAFYQSVGFRPIEWRPTMSKPAMWLEMLIAPPSPPA